MRQSHLILYVHDRFLLVFEMLCETNCTKETHKACYTIDFIVHVSFYFLQSTVHLIHFIRQSLSHTIIFNLLFHLSANPVSENEQPTSVLDKVWILDSYSLLQASSRDFTTPYFIILNKKYNMVPEKNVCSAADVYLLIYSTQAYVCKRQKYLYFINSWIS